MITQDEIREGMESIIQEFEDNSPDAGYGYENRAMADRILSYLHSKGVVIRVEKELPSISWASDAPLYDIAFGRGLSEERGIMLKWHKECLEPLIEGVV